MQHQRADDSEGAPQVFYPEEVAAESNPTGDADLKAGRKLVIRRVGQLRPHPSFSRHELTVPVAALSDAASQPDLTLEEPIIITHENFILKGYAHWQLAGLRRQETITCIEYELSHEEGLKWLLQSHRRANGLNDFARILLALDLEPWFQQKARSNQRFGGQNKGSSTLSEAARVDVRSEVAAAAGVSVGNVTKVKQLCQLAHPDVLRALRHGEVSIHRAWEWSKEAQSKQRSRLFQYQGEIGVRKHIRGLVSRHLPKAGLPAVAVGDLLRLLQDVNASNTRPLPIAVVEVPGCFIFVTHELFRHMELQQELNL
ncbi:MAG TPA: hypothetical protein VF753_07710 [Terriglobales bacterium]